MNKKNHQLAIEYFKFNGEWFPGCVLHHVDPTLKERDSERYEMWFPRDLQVLTRAEHNAIHKKGNTYNVGRQHSEESKKKMSDKKLGHVVSEETRIKISDGHKGLKLSDETKEKIGKCFCMSIKRIFQRLTGENLIKMFQEI